jgi:uncharacterized peroxidase-related enzyme
MTMTTTARLPLIDPTRATGPQKELLDAVRAKMGLVPNVVRALAGSPAALKSYIDFSAALAGGSLSARQREQLALAVAEVNACGYCLSAHTLIGGKSGLKEAQVLDARRGTADDLKTAALLKLAQRIVVERGHVKDADLRAAREAGASDAELAETVAVVAFNLFTNYFNHVAATPIDFPEVKPGVPAAVAHGSACTDGGCS